MQGPPSYTFREPRTIAFIILLIPTVLTGLLICAYVAMPANGGPSLGTLIGIATMAFLLFGLVAVSYLLPQIKIEGMRLAQRNQIGHTKTFNLANLTSVNAKRAFFVSFGTGSMLRSWILELTDRAGTKVNISLGMWLHESDLIRLIAETANANNATLNEAASRILSVSEN